MWAQLPMTHRILSEDSLETLEMYCFWNEPFFTWNGPKGVNLLQFNNLFKERLRLHSPILKSRKVAPAAQQFDVVQLTGSCTLLRRVLADSTQVPPHNCLTLVWAGEVWSTLCERTWVYSKRQLKRMARGVCIAGKPRWHYIQLFYYMNTIALSWN